MDDDTRALLLRLVKAVEDVTRQVMGLNEQVLQLEIRVALLESEREEED